jgi:hypothetical protein
LRFWVCADGAFWGVRGCVFCYSPFAFLGARMCFVKRSVCVFVCVRMMLFAGCADVFSETSGLRF